MILLSVFSGKFCTYSKRARRVSDISDIEIFFFESYMHALTNIIIFNRTCLYCRIGNPSTRNAEFQLKILTQQMCSIINPHHSYGGSRTDFALLRIFALIHLLDKTTRTQRTLVLFAPKSTVRRFQIFSHTTHLLYSTQQHSTSVLNTGNPRGMLKM